MKHQKIFSYSPVMSNCGQGSPLTPSSFIFQPCPFFPLYIFYHTHFYLILSILYFYKTARKLLFINYPTKVQLATHKGAYNKRRPISSQSNIKFSSYSTALSYSLSTPVNIYQKKPNSSSSSRIRQDVPVVQ